MCTTTPTTATGTAAATTTTTTTTTAAAAAAAAAATTTTTTKGQTIWKVMGGGRGVFSFHDFFFRRLLVQEFFLQVKPSARIFFQTNITLFVIY